MLQFGSILTNPRFHTPVLYICVCQKKPVKQLTHSPNSPAADKLSSTESKVLKCEILQFSFPRLKAIVGKENNGGVIPETAQRNGQCQSEPCKSLLQFYRRGQMQEHKLFQPDK